MNLEECPDGCRHVTFHYCVNGTHCDKHCTCPCRMCVDGFFNVGGTYEKPSRSTLVLPANDYPDANVRAVMRHLRDRR